MVVNGSGGLDDPALEASVRMVRLERNTGPAGGFRAGLVAAFEDPDVRWAYLCEDDVGLFDLPTPRVARLVDLLEGEAKLATTGAVVAYGRRFVGRGHSVNVVPAPDDPALVPVDVACWGATLVSRRVVERGVLPDEAWFFGYEDFDFFCRVRAAGLGVLVDTESARAAAEVQTLSGRDQALSGDRPVDADEPWRAYYVARNFFHLARAHGRPNWLAWHLAYSARRMQRSGERIRAARHIARPPRWRARPIRTPPEVRARRGRAQAGARLRSRPGGATRRGHRVRTWRGCCVGREAWPS